MGWDDLTGPSSDDLKKEWWVVPVFLLGMLIVALYLGIGR
jgi:hypothetical protein